MEGRRLQELRQRRGDLDSGLAETRLALIKAQQQQRDKKKASDKVWVLSAYLVRTLLAIYALADCEPEPAVKFLVDVGRKRRWPPKPEDDLERIVGDQFLAHDPAEIAAWADVASPSDGNAAHLKVALKYVEECRLVGWTRGHNFDRGVAPSTGAVLRQLEATRAALPGERRLHQGTGSEAKTRMWAYRWRRRWG